MASTAIGYIIAPVLLLGYWLKPHPGWLYILGVMSVVSIAVISLALYVALDATDAQRYEMFRKTNDRSRITRILARIYSACILLYMVYAELFINATLLLIGVVLGSVMLLLVTNQQDEDDDIDDDQVN